MASIGAPPRRKPRRKSVDVTEFTPPMIDINGKVKRVPLPPVLPEVPELPSRNIPATINDHQFHGIADAPISDDAG